MINIKPLKRLCAYLRFVNNSYLVCAVIFTCCSFLIYPQISFSLDTKEEQALKLIHSLRSENDFIKIETIEEELIGMGPSILEILISVLDEELNKEKINRELTISVIRVLGVIHNPLSVHVLLKATNIVDWIVREEAVSALVSTIDYNPTNLDMLVTILNANDSYAQNSAKDAILEIESHVDVTTSLIEEMQVNSETTVRVFIVKVLSQIKSDDAIKYLFSLLDDYEEEVRKESVKELYRINAIKKEIGNDKLLKILDIIKDDISFIELWDEVIEELNVPGLKDTGFLIEALKVGVNAESHSLKREITNAFNRIGKQALDELNRALENTKEGSPLYSALLDIINNINEAAETTGVK